MLYDLEDTKFRCFSQSVVVSWFLVICHAVRVVDKRVQTVRPRYAILGCKLVEAFKL
jgi:hypothetical protein